MSSLCVLSACSGSSGSAESLLSDTFSGHQQIESGEVNLSFALTGSGSSASSAPLSVRLSGPFQNAQSGKLPRFALKLDLTAAGHTLRAGATSTGSALFVDLAGTWFSTPQSTFKSLEEGYAQATKSATPSKVHSTFAALGIEPGHWLSDPVKLGTTTVAGVETVHIGANIDIPGFLADVSKLSQSGGALGSIPGAGTLTTGVISELAKAVKSAHVDVYTGADDHMLRRLEVDAAVTATPQTQAVFGGMKSANIKLELEFSGLNQPQTISAPSNPKSSSELLPSLEQLVGVLQGAGSSASSL